MVGARSGEFADTLQVTSPTRSLSA